MNSETVMEHRIPFLAAKKPPYKKGAPYKGAP